MRWIGSRRPEKGKVGLRNDGMTYQEKWNSASLKGSFPPKVKIQNLNIHQGEHWNLMMGNPQQRSDVALLDSISRYLLGETSDTILGSASYVAVAPAANYPVGDPCFSTAMVGLPFKEDDPQDMVPYGVLGDGWPTSNASEVIDFTSVILLHACWGSKYSRIQLLQPKVESGFLTLYRTPEAQLPSLAESVAEEVKRLVEKYMGETLSIIVTGNSLGSALVTDEIGLGRLGASQKRKGAEDREHPGPRDLGAGDSGGGRAGGGHEDVAVAEARRLPRVLPRLGGVPSCGGRALIVGVQVSGQCQEEPGEVAGGAGIQHEEAV
ncbi:hypothetical protein SAY87_020529 [Trapa incisa]|uniref:Fungal lipase-type domain-containing protein n=1 Tax=Trapa incisa TaxID=236973 RepID=A0AAN7JQE6_9MYRT|nr:hypothetical protein SAY87_020529 [Trapa incisa]